MLGLELIEIIQDPEWSFQKKAFKLLIQSLLYYLLFVVALFGFMLLIITRLLECEKNDNLLSSICLLSIKHSD